MGGRSMVIACRSFQCTVCYSARGRGVNMLKVVPQFCFPFIPFFPQLYFCSTLLQNIGHHFSNPTTALYSGNPTVHCCEGKITLALQCTKFSNVWIHITELQCSCFVEESKVRCQRMMGWLIAEA